MDKLKILVVEDDKTTQKFYEAFLWNEIFEKRSAKDGEEALESYRNWHPDIIILDIMLPVLSGYTILKIIREEITDKSTPILISSSLSSKTDIIDIAKLGIQGYLVKPIEWKGIAFKLLDAYQKAYPDKTDYVAALIKMLEEKKNRRSNEETP